MLRHHNRSQHDHPLVKLLGGGHGTAAPCWFCHRDAGTQVSRAQFHRARFCDCMETTMDLATVDKLLTTTRSVRKRLDYSRPVPLR